MPSTFAAFPPITASAVSSAALEAIAAPIARKGRVKHVAQPMKDRRLVAGGQHVIVDPNVIFRPFRDPRQCTTGHDNQAATNVLNCLDLFQIRAAHVVEVLRVVRHQVIRAAPIEHQSVGELGPSFAE